MKRIIAIVLLLVFCLSLSGCRLIKRECELCHDAVGEYREDAGVYDYLCHDCYYETLLDDSDLFTEFDDFDYYDYDDDDDDDYYYYSNNYCKDCGDEIPSNRNYCDDCLEDFLDSLDDY